MQRTSAAGRIEVLDYLRGFFILVIIIDHLYRWPNLFQYISGRGELWASAAEGFVIISGLLVGYVRGRKNISKPLEYVSRKLVARGLMLYAWSIITTFFLVTASWVLTFKSPIAYVPYGSYDWSRLFSDAISLSYTHSLTHFLYLYAIFLVLSPILIALVRRGLWWLGAIISICLFIYGYVQQVEWMQWQSLFFIPAIAGFYLDQIIAVSKRIPRYILWILPVAGIVTIVWSASIALPLAPGSYHPPLFERDPITWARVGLSFLWFVTVAMLFASNLSIIKRYFGWLLLPFGTNSLTAYIIHSVPLMLIVWLLPPTDSIVVNSFLTVIAVLATWALIKIPGINRVIPR